MYVQDHKMVTKGEYLRTKSIQSEFLECFESENETIVMGRETWLTIIEKTTVFR